MFRRRLAITSACLAMLSGVQAAAEDDLAPVGLDNPTLAFNVSRVADFNTGFQFLDLMKLAAPWIGHQPGAWGGMTWGELQRGGYLDADGWLRAIPPDVERVGTILRFGNVPGNEARKKGIYLLRYDGRGRITLKNDARILSQRPGEIRFENKNGGTIVLDILETDPAGTGDHIRNMTLVREDRADLLEAGAVFDPDWLALIADARQIRFMHWMNTMRPDIRSWDEMASPAAPHSGHGQSLADMVRLANEIGTEPWFTMPHTADDAYIRQFALYVRDHLDPALPVRIEFSNETWNWSFPVTHWLADQARSAWGIEGGHADYYVKRSVEAMRIWDDVFAGEPEGRLVKVLAGQAVNTWHTGKLLAAEQWRRFEPDTWVDPGAFFDEFSIATYFGGGETVKPEGRAALIAAIEDPGTDATRYVLDLMRHSGHDGSVPEQLIKWREQARLARRAGLRLTGYEGGQHLHHSFAVKISDAEKETLTGFFGAFVNTPEMASIYQDAWEAWVSVGAGPFMQNTDIGKTSVWGSFGLRQTLDDENPRAALLERLNAQTPPWWDGAQGGEQYQQGVTQTGSAQDDRLVGTRQEDYLIGRAGDDIFRGGPEDDGLHGGPGTDRALFSGSVAAYTIRAEGDGYRIEGPDGSDFLIAIEEVMFDDTGPLVLQDMTRDANGRPRP